MPALPIVYYFRFTSHQQPLARSSTTANQPRPASLHTPSFVSLPALAISTTRRSPPTRVSTRISLSRAFASLPAFVPGEFNFSQSLWGVPTVPDVFAGFLKWFTIHCMCTCRTRLFGFRVSRSSAHDFMPLAGVSGATGALQVFSSLLHHSALSRTHSACSRGSRICPVCLGTLLCSWKSGVPPTPCISVRMFGVSTRRIRLSWAVSQVRQVSCTAPWYLDMY